MAMKSFFSLIAIVFCFVFCGIARECNHTIKKGSLIYDFSFAELAIQYLESGDTLLLNKMADLEATHHLLNHAGQFHYNVPRDSGHALLKYLLSAYQENPEALRKIKQNLQFARDSIAQTDFPQRICMQYLPEKFAFSGKLFFTVGYDVGVVFADNASLNIAHPRFMENPQEMLFYSIHELHHAGFVQLKEKQMPSLAITTYGEMAELIEFFTHLEGMGTYAPLQARVKREALDQDSDYLALMDEEKMEALEQKFFTIYKHFKNQPYETLTPADWEKLAPFTDGARLWYRVGAKMASEIDKMSGREKLTGLMLLAPEYFFEAYLSLQH